MSNLYQKMTDLKLELASIEIKKSGQNKHLGFRYHELGDFLGVIADLNKKHGIAEFISVTGSAATLTLVNTEKPDEIHIVSVPYVQADMQPKNDSIQKLGATLTYLRRYLYVQAYAITEHDVVDAMNLKEKPAVDNEKQAKRFFQHVVNTAGEKDAPMVARAYLEQDLKIESLRDIDFASVSLKDLITKFNKWYENKLKEAK